MTQQPTDIELARLADGSLPEARASELRAQVRDSPELAARLADQQRALAVSAQAAQITAPAGLHAAVSGQIAARAPGSARHRSSMRWGGVALAPIALAVAAVVVVVVLATRPTALTVARTARLALAAPTRSAPAVDRGDSDLLSLSVDSIAFPAYERHSDWRAVGARTDELDGRRVQTVFYDVAGRRVGYAIVPGAGLSVPAGVARTVGGVHYRLAVVAAGRLVTWRHDGHTCVIAGAHVDGRTLLELADAAQQSV